MHSPESDDIRFFEIVSHSEFNDEPIDPAVFESDLSRLHKILTCLPVISSAALLGSEVIIKTESKRQNKRLNGVAVFGQAAILEDKTGPIGQKLFPEYYLLLGSVYANSKDKNFHQDCETIVDKMDQSGSVSIDDRPYAYVPYSLIQDAHPLFYRAHTLTEIESKTFGRDLYRESMQGNMVAVQHVKRRSLLTLFVEQRLIIGDKVTEVDMLLNGTYTPQFK